MQSPDQSHTNYSGEAVLYRERGVSALDVQRAADALLRMGQKPSIASLRERMGGGSPNTIGPLLEKYWQSLGRRIQAGPSALERVPESLARLCEALWLRAVSEARERVKGDAGNPSFDASEALEKKVADLTASLAEVLARENATTEQLVTSYSDRLGLQDQLQQVSCLLQAEQKLHAYEVSRSDAQRREVERSREELRKLTSLRLAEKARAKGPPARATKSKRPSVKPAPTRSSKGTGSRKTKGARRARAKQDASRRARR